MSSENPYAPPLLPAEELRPEWPTAGVYREGNALVLHHTAGLPMVCLKTDLPADVLRTIELRVLVGSDRSIAPCKASFWWQNPLHRLNVPVSRVWLKRQQRWLRAGAVVVVIGVLMMLGGVAYAVVSEWDNGPRFSPQRTGGVVLGLSGVVVIGMGVAIRDALSTILTISFVAGGFFWIGGVSESYLRALPEWPVPPPSFWQQSLRWHPHAPVPPRRD